MRAVLFLLVFFFFILTRCLSILHRRRAETISRAWDGEKSLERKTFESREGVLQMNDHRLRRNAFKGTGSRAHGYACTPSGLGFVRMLSQLYTSPNRTDLLTKQSNIFNRADSFTTANRFNPLARGRYRFSDVYRIDHPTDPSLPIQPQLSVTSNRTDLNVLQTIRHKYRPIKKK